MGESHLPTPEAASYELALANRKLVTVVMGMTLLMGLVACLAYLAGRSVTGIRAEQASSSALPPPVIVERSPPPPLSAPAAQPVARMTPPNLPAAPSTTEALPQAAATVPPNGPRLFLQVAAGEVPDFQPLRSELQQAGFPIEIVLIENKHRLLVGPIQSQAQKQDFETRLSSAGHPFFARRL